MQIHQLVGFLTIVDTGSFTVAAEHLGITQSALSHAISNLEKELGVTLLQRDRQGARPTEVGERMATHIREIVSRLERIRTEARDTTGLLSGRVRIGSIPSATVDFLPRAMARFARQHPQIEVVMLEEPSQGNGKLMEWLNSHTIDLAVIEFPLQGHQTLPLLDDEMCAVLPSDSPLVKKAEVTAHDLLPLPFVLSKYSSEHLIQGAFQPAGGMPGIRFEVQDLGTLISLVREGLGISLVPRLALPKPPEGIELRSVAPKIKRQIGLVLRSLDGVSPAVKAFIQTLQKQAQEGS